MKFSSRQKAILDIVQDKAPIAISQIKELLGEELSLPQLNRELAQLVKHQSLKRVGAGRSTAYVLSPYYKIFAPIDQEVYFDLEPDHRGANTTCNFDLIPLLGQLELFDPDQSQLLKSLKEEYQRNISDLPKALFQKEMERLTIELSWKSSQIEGNTYSLLETERLFKEKIEAENKTKEEAIMLLNHKDAINYLMENKDIGKTIDVRFLEEIHSILIKGLKVSRNIRSRAVGITGTAYKPLDNEHQIREALERMCEVVNMRRTGFEKALLAVILISYIQPFEDGNKRTGRMIGNALLIADDCCPLSYRSVEALDYKKAMLLFYEQNNLSAFREIFIEQSLFGVKNYFS